VHNFPNPASLFAHTKLTLSFIYRKCSPKPVPKSHPICTLRDTPEKPVHCVAFATDLLFPKLFGSKRGETSDLDEQDAVELGVFSVRPNETFASFAARVYEYVFRKKIEVLLQRSEMWEKRQRPTALPTFAELVRGESPDQVAAGSDPTLTAKTASEASVESYSAQVRGFPIDHIKRRLIAHTPTDTFGVNLADRFDLRKRGAGFRERRGAHLDARQKREKRVRIERFPNPNTLFTHTRTRMDYYLCPYKTDTFFNLSQRHRYVRQGRRVGVRLRHRGYHAAVCELQHRNAIAVRHQGRRGEHRPRGGYHERYRRRFDRFGGG